MAEKQEPGKDEATGPLEKIKMEIQKVSAWKSEMEREEEQCLSHINNRFSSIISTLAQRRDLVVGNTKKRYAQAYYTADQQITELEKCMTSWAELNEEQTIDVKDVTSLSLHSFEKKLTEWKVKMKESEVKIDACSKAFQYEYNLSRLTMDRNELNCLLANTGNTNVDIGTSVNQYRISNLPANTGIIDLAMETNTCTFFFLKQDVGQLAEVAICSFDRQTLNTLSTFQIDRVLPGSFWSLGKKKPIPNSIALNSRHLFVSFSQENAVVILTRQGEYLETMTMDRCKNPLSLSNVQGLASDSEEYILICDSGNDRVLILKPDLKTTFNVCYSRNSLSFLCAPEKVSNVGRERMVVLHKGYPPLHMYNYQGEVIALFGALGSGMDRLVPQNLCYLPADEGRPELFICVGDYGPLPCYVLAFDIKGGMIYHFGSLDPDRIESASTAPGIATSPAGTVYLSISDRNFLYSFSDIAKLLID